MAVRLTLFALLAWVLAAGCTRYVPVETVRTEYREKDNTELLEAVRSLTERLHQKERQVDSLMQSRNERLVLNDNGDTLRHDLETIVYRSTHREKELEKLVKEQNDSIRKLLRQLESVKADSIPVPYPVERKLSRWEKAQMDFGGMAIGGVAVALCAAVAWIVKKRRRK